MTTSLPPSSSATPPDRTRSSDRSTTSATPVTSATPGDAGGCRIAGLYVYPVKSCRGIAVHEAVLEVGGLQHDREWMIVDAGSGRFLTQRELSIMARIVPSFEDGTLRLRIEGAPRQGTMRIPLDRTDCPPCSVTCWSYRATALDQGDDAANWLGDFLGRRVRLVRFDPANRRDCPVAWVGDSGAHTRFSDGYPVLVLGRASVDDLARRLDTVVGPPSGEALAIERFRPNVLVEGLAAYDEDFVDTLRAGNVELRLVKPCTRCVIPSIDPISGQVTPLSPLAALQGYRMDEKLGGATLGVNAIVSAGSGGHLRVGAPLQWEYRFS